jgi:hypothetical protein
MHLVVGYHAGAPAGALARATQAVQDLLTADPADLAIGLPDVKIVAADSHMLAPPVFGGDVPAAPDTFPAMLDDALSSVSPKRGGQQRRRGRAQGREEFGRERLDARGRDRGRLLVVGHVLGPRARGPAGLADRTQQLRGTAFEAFMMFSASVVTING